MPKIGRIAGATIDGVPQSPGNPVLVAGKYIRITDGAIEFFDGSSREPALRLTRDSDSGALDGALQVVEHDWNTHGWTGFSPSIITADDAQAFTVSTSGGRGVVTAASDTDANHRVAYLRAGTSWVNSMVTSTVYGPTADWDGTNAQQGHIHRAKLRSDGTWEAIVVWTSITGGSDYGYMHCNSVRWDGTTLTQADGADEFSGPFGYGDSTYIDHRLQVIGVQRQQPLLWVNDYRVAKPWRVTVTTNDLVTASNFVDTTFNTASTVAIQSITDAAAGIIRVIDATHTSAVAYTATKLGYLTPGGVDGQKRWCPFRLSTRVIGGTATSVSVESKRWHVDEAEPDWGDARVQRGSIAADADVPDLALGPGLCGLWAGHFNTSSGGAWGPVRFELAT